MIKLSIYFPTARTLRRAVATGLVLRWAFVGAVQAQYPAVPLPPMPGVSLDTVAVAPQAVDTQGWLLLDPGLRLELEGAVHNLYNFKFDRADKQFRSLRRRYPQHPMPYFLLGLSLWWRIVPGNLSERAYDRPLLALMDTAADKARALYRADEKNYEACFFLAAASGFAARLHSERGQWAQATVLSRRALNFLNKSRQANGLSAEFLFGQALFDYYAVWIGEEYPWLRPVLFFFPKGDRARGLAELRTVARDGFYTGPEAAYFLLRILSSDRENQAAAALPVARQLSEAYPDNSYFERAYAKLLFVQGNFAECEQVSRRLLDKINVGLPGYEAHSGRVAAYLLAYALEQRGAVAEAKGYFQRCVVFAETSGELNAGYYLFANERLARQALAEHDQAAAVRYYRVVREHARKGSPQYREAGACLKGAAR